MKDVSLDDLIKEDKLKQRTFNKEKAFTKNRRPEYRVNPNGHNHNQSSKFDRNFNQSRRPFNRDHDEKWERNNQNFRNNHDQPQKTKKITHERYEKHERPHNQPAQEKKQPEQQAPKFEKGRTLKVLGLHPDITNEDLYKLFSAEGALDKCLIEQDNFGRNLPSAIVQYHTADTAKNAISSINGRKVLNSILTVEPYKNVRN